MKRIIALFLAVSFFPLICNVSFAEESAVNEFEKCATGLLSAISVIDEEYNPEEYVSRNEFARMVCKLAGFSDGDLSSEISPFSDVSSDSEFAPYIRCIRELKIISGYSDGTFRGEENISVMEVLTVFLRLLGYSKLAAVKGAYPAGYVMLAKQLKLLSGAGCGFDGEITKGNLAIIAVNALESEIYSAASVEGDSVVMENSGTTLLKSSFGITLFEGIVDATEVTRLFGDADDISSRFIMVDGLLILSEDVQANDFLGYSVKAYCEEKASGMFSLRYIAVNPGENTVYEMNVSEIDGIKDYNVILADENGKEKKYSYVKTAPVIYNGISTTEAFEYEMLSGAEGSLKLLDNNGDGKADVVFLNIYTDITVGATDSVSFTVYDMYDKNNNVQLDTYSDNPYVVIYNSEGMEIPFSVIKKRSVISIEKTLPDSGQTLIKAVVSDSKVSGKLEAVFSDGIETFITVNGETYSVTSTCLKNCEKEIEVGRVIEAGLDKYGKCAYIRNITGEFSFGYIIHAGKENAFEGKVNIKLLTTGGEAGIYSLSEKFNIDGREYKNYGDDLLSALNKGAEASLWLKGKKPENLNVEADFYTQPVRYRLNGNGEIDYIDTVLNESHEGSVLGTRANMNGNNRLYMFHEGALRYKINGRSLEGKIVVPADAVILQIPSYDDADKGYRNAENYKLVRSSMFADNQLYDVAAFFDGSDRISAGLYTVNYSSTTGWLGTSSPLPVFISCSTAVAPDGSVAKKVILFENGNSKTMFCENDTEFVIPEGNSISGSLRIDDLKTGDVISYVEGKEGYITDFELNYRAEDNLFIKGMRYDSDINGAFRFVSAYINRVEEDGFEMKVTDDISKMSDPEGMETLLKPSCKITVYDKSAKGKNRVRTGSYSELIGYEKAGSSCSQIIIQQRYIQSIMIYIVR